MSYNQHVEDILSIASDIRDALDNLVTPIDSGEKPIDDTNINETHVNEWEDLKEKVYDTISDTEVAWIYHAPEDEFVDENE